MTQAGAKRVEEVAQAPAMKVVGQPEARAGVAALEIGVEEDMNSSLAVVAAELGVGAVVVVVVVGKIEFVVVVVVVEKYYYYYYLQE